MVENSRKQFETVKSMEKVEISQEMAMQKDATLESSWKRWCARMLVENPYIIAGTYSSTA